MNKHDSCKSARISGVEIRRSTINEFDEIMLSSYSDTFGKIEIGLSFCFNSDNENETIIKGEKIKHYIETNFINDANIKIQKENR